MRTAETKKYQFAEENVKLYHNIGFNGSILPAVTFASAPIFYNIWADIDKGSASYQRIGDKITPRGMSLKIYLACAHDRPNTKFRVIIAKVPKQVGGVVTTYNSITNPWDAEQLGATGNKLIMNLDKDRGIKALYDKIHTLSVPFTAGAYGKQNTKVVKLWIRNRKARDIVYDSTNSNQIVNNPILMWIIPYEEYSTLETDEVGTCAYRGILYYKDV